MKENLIKAFGCVLAISIAMIIVDLIGGNRIDFQHAFLTGVIVGIIDFIFSTVSGRIKDKKSR